MRLFILIFLLSLSLGLPLTSIYARSQFTLPPSQYTLTVKTTPHNATVKIMNIKPSYEDGILLKEGNYRLEISAPGYETVKKTVLLSKKDKIVYIALRKKTPLISKQPPAVEIIEEPPTITVNSTSVIIDNNEPEIIQHSSSTRYEPNNDIVVDSNEPETIQRPPKRRFIHTKGYNRFLRRANRLYGISYKDPRFERYCKQYANLAIRQAQRRIDNHCEQEISILHNDKASQWQLDKRPQQAWCRTVSAYATYNETVYREERLEYCIAGYILRSK